MLQRTAPLLLHSAWECSQACACALASYGCSFDLGLANDPYAWRAILGGHVRDGTDVVWGLKFLAEVARTYGLPAGQSDKIDLEEAHASEAIRIGVILFVCALAAAPQYDVIKEGDATLMLGVDGPSVPFGFRMVRGARRCGVVVWDRLIRLTVCLAAPVWA